MPFPMKAFVSSIESGAAGIDPLSHSENGCFADVQNAKSIQQKDIEVLLNVCKRFNFPDCVTIWPSGRKPEARGIMASTTDMDIK